MAKTTPAAALTTGQIRALVIALPHQDIWLLAQAAGAFAVQLDAADKIYPAHELREDAARLRKLAESLFNANQARDFILKGE